MNKFYEVRRQLQNRNRWIKEAFFQNRDDAEYYVKRKLKYLKSRNPKHLNMNLEVVEHRFHAPLGTFHGVWTGAEKS